MQSATTLAIGNDGITIPALGNRALGFDAELQGIKVVLRVPTLNAGVHTVATSDDGGTTWVTASGPLNLTGYETPNPTAAGNTGGFRVVYGPYIPGVKIRVTSSVAQTANISAYFMV